MHNGNYNMHIAPHITQRYQTRQWKRFIDNSESVYTDFTYYTCFSRKHTWSLDMMYLKRGIVKVKLSFSMKIWLLEKCDHSSFEIPPLVFRVNLISVYVRIMITGITHSICKDAYAKCAFFFRKHALIAPCLPKHC